MNKKKNVLLCAEAVTLAHLARPLALAPLLSELGWATTVACDSRYDRFLRGFAGAAESLPSIEPVRFLRALRAGVPAYDVETLERYVRDDMRVIERVRPALIIGDFRLSLSVSARLARVPYIALANAYWSPAYLPETWPVPELPITQVLPVAVAALLFRLARHGAFAWHSRPLNELRRRHGLPKLGTDLRALYTDGDHVAYADIPELFPVPPMPGRHFLGATLWDPPVPRPQWWDAPLEGRPVVYVSLGSSGRAGLLPKILPAIAALDAHFIVATGGATVSVPPNVRTAEFLPGTEAARRASLVICNGGSLGCYQALAAGVPVIGIASNLDQFLNMQAVERAGAGVTMRADRASGARLAALTRRVLEEPSFASNAKQVADWCARRPLTKTVPAMLEAVL